MAVIEKKQEIKNILGEAKKHFSPVKLMNYT